MQIGKWVKGCVSWKTIRLATGKVATTYVGVLGPGGGEQKLAAGLGE
jgi:hypothetical protein